MIFNATGSTSKMGGMDSFQGLGKKLGDSASSPAVPRKISPGELALRAAEARAAKASQADATFQPQAAGPAPKPKPKISDLPPIPRVKQQVKPDEKEIKKKIKVEVIDLCTTEDEEKKAKEDQAKKKKVEEAALWSEDELPWMKEYLEERANGGKKKKEKAPEKTVEKVKGKKRAFEGDSDADSDYLPDIDVIMKDGKEKDDKNSKEQSSKPPKKLSQPKLPKSNYFFPKDSPVAALKEKEVEKRKKKKGNKLMTDSEGESEDIETVKVKKNVEKKKVGEKKESKEKEKEKVKNGGSAGKKKLLSDDSE